MPLNVLRAYYLFIGHVLFGVQCPGANRLALDWRCPCLSGRDHWAVVQRDQDLRRRQEQTAWMLTFVSWSASATSTDVRRYGTMT